MNYLAKLVLESGLDLNVESQTVGFFAGFRPKLPCTKASSYLRNSCSICH